MLTLDPSCLEPCEAGRPNSSQGQSLCCILQLFWSFEDGDFLSAAARKNQVLAYFFHFFRHNWSFLFCHSVNAYFFCLWQALFFPLECCLEVRGSLCLAINCQNLPVDIVNLHTPWWALPWTHWVATRSPSCCVTCLGSSCSVPSLAAVISLQEIQNLFHVLQWTFSCLEGLCSWIAPLPFLFLTSHIRQNYSSKKKSSAVAMCPVLRVCLSVRVNVLWVLNLCVRHGWLLQGEHLHRFYWLLLTVFACVIENVVSERRPQATLPEIC